jgi:hypothetical protein
VGGTLNKRMRAYNNYKTAKFNIYMRERGRDAIFTQSKEANEVQESMYRI